MLPLLYCCRQQPMETDDRDKTQGLIIFRKLSSLEKFSLWKQQHNNLWKLEALKFE